MLVLLLCSRLKAWRLGRAGEMDPFPGIIDNLKDPSIKKKQQALEQLHVRGARCLPNVDPTCVVANQLLRCRSTWLGISSGVSS